MTDNEILTEMRAMMGRYSCEGLSCDGESPPWVQQAHARRGIKRWTQLEKMLGRKPTYKDMYGDKFFAKHMTDMPCKPEGL